VSPQLGLATATARFHLRFVSPPNVVSPKPRSASSEAFGRPVTLPRQDGLFLGRPQRSEAAQSRKDTTRATAPRSVLHRAPSLRCGRIHAKPTSMTELEVTGLACRRGGRPVFGNLSFSLAGGELLALT